MALTLAQLREYAKHAIGGGDPSVIVVDAATTLNQWVNEAGTLLVSAYTWKFLERPMRYGSFERVDVTGAVYSHSTRTLTKAGAFSTFYHDAGAVFVASSGTGVVAGEYGIAGRVSDDAITLLGDGLGQSADGSSNVSGHVVYSYVRLPADFHSLVSVTVSERFGRVELTSLSDLMRRRTFDVPYGPDYWAAVSHPPQTSSGSSAPAPILLLWPTPKHISSTDDDALVVVYRAGWQPLLSDSSVPNVPEWIEPLLVQFVRAVAQGYEEADTGSLTSRIAEVVRGPVWEAALRRDGGVQPEYGRMSGGWMDDYAVPSNWSIFEGFS